MTQLLDMARPRRLLPPSTDRWQLLAVATFAGVCVLPIALLLLAGLAPSRGASMSATLVLRAVGGSLATAAASTVLGATFGVVLGESARRSVGVLGSALRVGTLLPLAVPPIVFALGVRVLLEAGGFGALARGETTWLWSTLPVVLVQSIVTLAIVGAAWGQLRPSRDDGEVRAREEGARLLGLAPVQRWLMVDRPSALRALALGGALAFLHAFTSLAAPLMFPRAGLASLPLLLHHSSVGVSGLGAVLPLLITLPVLAIAWRLRPTHHDRAQPISVGIRVSPWLVPGALVIATGVLAPLLAVLVHGFTPAAVGALLRGEGGVALSSALGGTVLLALAAAAGALLPLAYVALSVSRWFRGGLAGWVLLGVPPVSLAALAAGGLENRAWLTGALAIHVALGYVAALPAVARLQRAGGAFSDAARVLGADGMQPAFWGGPALFVRGVVAAVMLGVLASIGDVAILAPGAESTAHTLSQAIPTLMADPGVPSAGAFALASMLIAFAAGGLLVLLRSGAAGEAIWSRR